MPGSGARCSLLFLLACISFRCNLKLLLEIAVWKVVLPSCICQSQQHVRIGTAVVLMLCMHGCGQDDTLRLFNSLRIDLWGSLRSARGLQRSLAAQYQPTSSVY